MNDIEKALTGVKGGEKLKKLFEGIEELDGIPKDDDDEKKDDDVVAVDKNGDGVIKDDEVIKENDVEMSDDDIADAVADDAVAGDIKDEIMNNLVDMTIDLMMADFDPVEKLTTLMAVSAELDGDAGESDNAATPDAIATPDAENAGDVDADSHPMTSPADVDDLKRELAAKDARIQELESQLNG